MIGFVGIIIIFVMVFGGYMLAGGKMGIIMKALPFEMIMIGGAALGAFVLSNDMSSIKHTLKDIGKVPFPIQPKKSRRKARSWPWALARRTSPPP